jgi:hypothetical protein
VLSGGVGLSFLIVTDKVVEPENIRSAEFDPLQPHTLIATRFLLGAYPDDFSPANNRTMILGQMNVDLHPISDVHTFTGADKNSNRAYILGLSFGCTTIAYQTVLGIDACARKPSFFFHMDLLRSVLSVKSISQKQEIV